jgi:hypothetical protein
MPAPHDTPMAELSAEATHTASRVALYEQKIYSGRGDERRLAELRREADGAAERLAAGRAKVAAATIAALPPAPGGDGGSSSA